MGNSKPPKAQFDLIGSYARRRGADVEIVLADPVAEISSLTQFTLRRAGRDLTAPVELAAGSPARLVARLPRTQLSDGIWILRRDAAGGDEQRLGARLLVQGDRPVVLLWGGITPPAVVPKAVRHLPPRNRAIAQAGGALTKALNALPDERAAKVRAAVRDRARRTLG